MLHELKKIDNSILLNEEKKLQQNFKDIYDEVLQSSIMNDEKPFTLCYSKDVPTFSKKINNI